jgi:NADPH:quinone reductase-like Zn-dependent oxidoreductase
LSRFIGPTLRALTASENAADLVVLTGLVEAGKLTPVIDSIYPLSEAPAAIQHLVDGHARGKIVITV